MGSNEDRYAVACWGSIWTFAMLLLVAVIWMTYHVLLGVTGLVLLLVASGFLLPRGVRVDQHGVIVLEFVLPRERRITQDAVQGIVCTRFPWLTEIHLASSRVPIYIPDYLPKLRDTFEEVRRHGQT